VSAVLTGKTRPHPDAGNAFFPFRTAYGPFSLFILEEKEKTGRKSPPVFTAEITPPAGAETAFSPWEAKT